MPAVERDRRAGAVAQHRLRQADLPGRGAAHGGHGGQARAAVLLRPGTARPYDPNSNESLADFVKRQNMGSFTLGPLQLNALELSNVATTLASGGVWCPPSPIDKIFDRHGREVAVTTERCAQVVPEGLANTLANALSKDAVNGTAADSASAAGWTSPMSGKTGTTECHRSSGFVGFTNRYAAANYIFDDSDTPTGICSFPLRTCGSGDLYGGNEPARTWFTAMTPIAANFGDVRLPPTDPRYVDGGSGGKVPGVAGTNLDQARQRLKDAGFQVADQPTPVNSSASYGTVVGTTPNGDTIPGSIITINTSTGIAPALPPVERPPTHPPDTNDQAPPPPDSNVVDIPGLPPITIPEVLAPHPRKVDRHRRDDKPNWQRCGAVRSRGVPRRGRTGSQPTDASAGERPPAAWRESSRRCRGARDQMPGGPPPTRSVANAPSPTMPLPCWRCEGKQPTPN